MNAIVPVLLVAAVSGTASALIAGWMTRRPAWLPHDEPNDRSLHERPVPRSGGLAVMAGFLAGSLLITDATAAMLVGITLALSAVSFVDDWRGLSAAARLTAHLIASVLFCGILLTGLPVWLLIAIGLALAWMTNLYNFMDGSDGLAGGMAVCGFSAYAIAAWTGGDSALALTSISLAAAALGFLAFNFPPARIFMGDVGSIPLGFLAGAIGSLGWQRGLWPAWFPLLVFAPFVVDASVTLARRLLRGEKVWQAHRRHYYQRVVRMGWGHLKTALAEYALMVAGAAAALLARDASRGEQFEVLGFAAIIYCVLMVLVDRQWRRNEAASC